MILIDTNVISEPLRAAPHQQVVAWLDAQPVDTLFLSVVTVAELRLGVMRLPAGRRRNLLIEQLESRVLPAFTGRVLPSIWQLRNPTRRLWRRRKPIDCRSAWPTA